MSDNKDTAPQTPGIRQVGSTDRKALAKLTVPELEELAETLGVDRSGSPLKDELIGRIATHCETAAAPASQETEAATNEPAPAPPSPQDQPPPPPAPPKPAEEEDDDEDDDDRFVIQTQNPLFNGQRVGLAFRNGRAETRDPKLARRAHELGYIVTAE